VRLFYSLLPQRHRWVEAQAQAAEFIIDETFGVPGVGTVVAGGSRGERPGYHYTKQGSWGGGCCHRRGMHIRGQAVGRHGGMAGAAVCTGL
jgi:hypothetical protein